MELSARGHEVHFITYANPIRLSGNLPRIHYHEVEVSDYPLFQYPPYSLALASRMAETAAAEKLDLLHVHYAIPHSISAWLASRILDGKIPFVTTLHGTDVTLVGSDPSFLPITKLSIEQSPGVTTISEYLRKETQRVFSTDKEIRVIPNFVNCNLYRPEPDAELRRRYAAPGEKLLIHVSNFRPVKRILDCVRVLAKVNEGIPSRLLMVGDGPDRVPAQALARELGMGERVIFVGKQLSVAPLLAIADLSLLPSEMEGFGLVALEAAACGVPTIASDVGGLPEVIDSGSNGFLVPVGMWTRWPGRRFRSSGKRKGNGLSGRRRGARPKRAIRRLGSFRNTRPTTRKFVGRCRGCFGRLRTISNGPGRGADRSPRSRRQFSIRSIPRTSFGCRRSSFGV